MTSKLKLLPITMTSKTPSCQILPLFFFSPFFSYPLLQSNGNVGELVYEHEKDPFEIWFNVVWNDCIAFVLDFTHMWQSILSNEIEFVAWFWSLIKYNDKIMYEIDIRWNTLRWNKNDTSWKRYKGFFVNFRLLKGNGWQR